MRWWLAAAALLLVVADAEAAPRKRARRARKPVPAKVAPAVVEVAATAEVDAAESAPPEEATATVAAAQAPPAEPGAEVAEDVRTSDGPVLAASADEGAAPVPTATFSVASNALGEWHGVNGDIRSDNDRYGMVLMRHNLLLEGGTARAAVRVDQEVTARNELVVEEGAAPYRVDRRNSSRLERVTLEAERSWDPVTLRGSAGDFYAQLGRGLVLVLRKYDELGVDVSARGAKAEAAFLRERLNLVLLGGVTNIVNVDPDVHSYVPDPDDKVGGARIEGRIAEVLVLSAQGATVQTGTEVMGLAAQDRAYNFGGGVDLDLGSWTGGVEMARQFLRVSDVIEQGSAIYATASGPIGPLTVLTEFKHYQKFEPLRSYHPGSTTFIQYNLAPSAERVDQELLDNTDVTGGRLRVDWTIGATGNTVLHASYGLFRNRHLAQNIGHGFAGVRHRRDSGAGVFLVGGVRREIDATTNVLSRQILQGEVDVTLPVSARLSLHASAHGDGINKTEGFSTRGNSLLELDWRSKLALGGGYEWDTTSPGSPTHYGFGALSVRPGNHFVAQVVVGTQRGGLKCFAGVCRQVPPFAGGRLDLTVRF